MGRMLAGGSIMERGVASVTRAGWDHAPVAPTTDGEAFPFVRVDGTAARRLLAAAADAAHPTSALAVDALRLATSAGSSARAWLACEVAGYPHPDGAPAPASVPDYRRLVAYAAPLSPEGHRPRV